MKPKRYTKIIELKMSWKFKAALLTIFSFYLGILAAMSVSYGTIILFTLILVWIIMKNAPDRKIFYQEKKKRGKK